MCVYGRQSAGLVGSEEGSEVGSTSLSAEKRKDRNVCLPLVPLFG